MPHRPRLLDLFCCAGGAAIERRFWSYVSKEGPDACWPWTGSRRPTGYGQLNVGGYPVKAHRLAFVLAFGFEPEVVMHKCDNPPCVNPRHLLGGTQADNMADAARKGRARNSPKLGEANAASKLTDDEVREIRAIWDECRPPITQLARRFGVHHKTMRQIVDRQRWVHV